MTRPIDGAALPQVTAAKPKGKQAGDGFRQTLQSAATVEDAAAEGVLPAAPGPVEPTRPVLTLRLALAERGDGHRDGVEDGDGDQDEVVLQRPVDVADGKPIAMVDGAPAARIAPAAEQVAQAVARALPDRAPIPAPKAGLPAGESGTAARAPEQQTPAISNVVVERHVAPARPAVVMRAENGAPIQPQRSEADTADRNGRDRAAQARPVLPTMPDEPAVRAEPAPRVPRDVPRAESPRPQLRDSALSQQATGPRPQPTGAPQPAMAGPAGQPTESPLVAQIARPVLADSVVRSSAEPPAAPAQSASTAEVAQGGAVRTLRLSLTPSELGEVTVRMRLTDAGLEVHLQPSRPETAQLLRQDRDTIAGLLRAAGYAADTANVTVAERGAQTGGTGFGDTAGQRSAGDGAQNPAEGRAGRSGDQDSRTDHRATAEHQHEDAADPARPSGDLYL